MARKDKQAIRKQRLDRKQREIEKENELELALEEEGVLEEPERDVESKSYGDVMIEPMLSATSFAELDKLTEAQHKAEAVRKVSYQVQDLVHNILYYSNMNPKQKADAIKRVSDEFAARVEDEVKEEVKEYSFDELDLLAVKAMIATDQRHTPLMERLTDWVTKKKLTTAAENALSDDDFALVYEVDGNKVRAYPIHDKAHVRNALARASQMIEKGREAATDAKKALPKIRDAAKRMGIGEMEKSKSAVIVEKAVDGQWRAVMLPSNNFIDWHGDIISEAAHQEYVGWLEKNMDCAPVFMTWHIPGTAREAAVDFAAYENGFLIMSSPLTESEAAGLLRAQADCDIGMSHTSIVLERDPKDARVITKYRMVEVTDLPLEAAANPFTDFEITSKEAAMDTKKYLASILGSEEKADAFLKKTGMKKKELVDAEIPNKEVAETSPEAEAAPAAPEGMTIEKVIETVAKEFGMEELSAQFALVLEKAEKVDALEALVKELAQKEDEKLAEKIAPPAVKSFSWMDMRASQQKETVLKEGDAKDEALKKAKPDVGWLSEITNTTPIQ